ncbi:hypothetical protein KFK09_022083 [Dendrobium nobile]|uniref:Uncharacterized protein n=1 Tax=Dendrobium nobile TaxID=94219 RepID=A0A8T3AI33_DENNO|nr:hypothetical protein KFK09_022083 [Dendrobium nobile]
MHHSVTQRPVMASYPAGPPTRPGLQVTCCQRSVTYSSPPRLRLARFEPPALSSFLPAITIMPPLQNSTKR